MEQSNFIPILSQSDVEQAIFLIQSAYIPGQNVEESRRMQQQLFEMQKRPEAWGLIVPLLEHPDPNVQFFGAHTAQVKIARDWETFPQEQATELRSVLLTICGRSAATTKNKLMLRKLFVAISSLALRLVPGHPSKWTDWILTVVTSLSGSGANREYILEFLEIAAEEVGTADLTSTSKAQIQQSLTEATPIVNQALSISLPFQNSSENERHAAFRCLEAWIMHLTANDLNTFIPILIDLLSNESSFIGAADVLQEILSASSFSDGAGTKVLTVPLLNFLEREGAAIVQQTISTEMVDEISHSLCKLLVALGEHSTNYFATNLSTPPVQTFVRLLFTYTSLPGYYGVDEEESEMTLSFWYLLQESLWSVDFGDGYSEAEDALVDWAESIQGPDAGAVRAQSGSQPGAAVPIYMELVQALKRKVTWPEKEVLATWTRDQRDKFQVYRRDVGDSLINAYYILRHGMLKPFIEELVNELASPNHPDAWENVEAILHCIMSIQEAIEIMENPYLERLFGPEILGKLPTTGHDRVRRTTLNLIGAYASWFTIVIDARLLLSAVNYVVEALESPALCLAAANALRDLCDANRTKLARYIGAFGELHTRLPGIPDTEKTKVVQSITSVIQALPPMQEIEPVDAIVSPIVVRLAEALNSANHLPEEARAVALQQLQALTGCAKGLTRVSDVLFAYEDSASVHEMERLREAREDSRMIRLRQDIIQALQAVMGLWSNDATTADALSSLIVSITALPQDMTLISLPPDPLLELVCGALQRLPNAVWLSLSGKLIRQLDPPSLTTLLSVPSAEANATVLQALPLILDASLNFFQNEGAMEANPDIVQAFFDCMEKVVHHFAGLFFELPPGALDALMHYTVRALSLQERYSLVAACTFLVLLINKTVPTESLGEKGKLFVRTHGRAIIHAILFGVAGAAPSSTTQNLIELLVTLVQRCPDDCKVFIPEILFSDEFLTTKATRADKEKFVKVVLASRSTKRTREAAAQFALIAKGLEGTGFGYSSISM